MNTLRLTRTLFWDTDYETLDPEKNAPFIVERVMQRGNVQDFKAIVEHYGKVKLREIIRNLRYLDKKVLHFASVYFAIPLHEMRCYTIRQSTPIHWDY